MIYVVSNERDACLIEKIDLESGTYLRPTIIKHKQFIEIAEELASWVLSEKPSQIIFEKFGVGIGYYDSFVVLAPERGIVLAANGVVGFR